MRCIKGEVSERLKERDWKSRSCRKVAPGFESLPLRIFQGEESKTMRKILPESTIVQAKDQVSCELDGEAVILGLKKGFYYGLDPVGAHVWNLLKRPVRVDEIRDDILKNFDVEFERCEKDLAVLLKELLKEGLIETRGEGIPP